MKINNTTEFYNFISNLPSNEDFYDYISLFNNVRDMCAACKAHLINKIQQDLNERYKQVVNKQTPAFKNYLRKNFEKEIQFCLNNEVFAEIKLD